MMPNITVMLRERLQLNNWPIRNKLIVHFLLISILPSLCITFLFSLTVSNMLEKQANQQTLQLIGNVNKSLDAHTANIQNVSYFVAMNPEVQTFLSEGHLSITRDEDRYRVFKFLQGFTTLYSEIAGIMVVSADGHYLSNEMYARGNSNLTEEYWYREAVAAKGIFKMIGRPVNRNVITHANYKENELISVVRAIQDPETGTNKGVVIIDLKLRAIAETVRDVKLGKRGYLVVIDEQGNSIYAPGHAVTIGKPLSESMASNASNMLAREVNGEKLQFIYQKSSFTNWTIVGVFPLQDMLQEIKDINLYLVLFVFVVCMLGITASYFLSNSISRPITQLASVVRKVEEGNMSLRMSGERSDEIGLLGRSFNKMLIQINRLLSQVELEQRKKREAELRSLQAHIQPHFLYNTLDTIQWLARKDGAREATEMVEALSKLFRLGLSKGQELIPLEDELDHIGNYLKIQKTRYKDKLNYSIHMDDNCRNLTVLKLILQPVVENAIYHGIKERRGPGFIGIRVTLLGGYLMLVIEDDGAGMTDEKLQHLRQSLVLPLDDREESIGSEELTLNGSRIGYGLRNVQERMQLGFGIAYGISVESAAGSGSTVTLRHPVLKARGRDGT
jgi:two-component system, sensor histidine kinase YesM